MRCFFVVLSMAVSVSASAQLGDGTIDVPAYELRIDPPPSPLVRRHRLARRSGIAVIPSLVVMTMGYAGLWVCAGSSDPDRCSGPVSMIGMSGGGALFAGAIFVYATNKQSRELRRAGALVSRARGVLASVLYALPYLQPIALILAGRQARLNRIALRQIEDEQLRYY